MEEDLSKTRLLTPQGRRSRLTPEAWSYVHSREFKDVFGDWEVAMLIRQARNAWVNPDSTYRFDFIPSQKLSQGFFILLGHEVKNVTITDSTIRHIRNHHSMDESIRGQMEMTPEDIGVIPYVMNEYDDIYENPVYSKGPGARSLTITKRINGTTIVGTIENGLSGNLVLTAWQKKRSGAPMPDIKDTSMAPGLYVRNEADSVAKVKKDIETIKSSVDNIGCFLNDVMEPDVRFVIPIEEWRIPTPAEFTALRDAVNATLTDNYMGTGIGGMVCTDKTDASKVLFFPGNGHTIDGTVDPNGNVIPSTSVGYYWSNNIVNVPFTSVKDAINMYFYHDTADHIYWLYTMMAQRSDGKHIRGILDK